MIAARKTAPPPGELTAAQRERANAERERHANSASERATGEIANAEDELTSECKRFATLRAEMALRGYSLSRTHGDDGPARYYVTRWNLVRELRDIAAVRVFAQQVGATNA